MCQIACVLCFIYVQHSTNLYILCIFIQCACRYQLHLTSWRVRKFDVSKLLCCDRSWNRIVNLMTRQCAGQSGVQYLAGTRIFSVLQNVQHAFCSYPAYWLMDTGELSLEVKWVEHEATTDLHLVLRLRMSEAVLLLLLCAFMACTGTS